MFMPKVKRKQNKMKQNQTKTVPRNQVQFYLLIAGELSEKELSSGRGGRGTGRGHSTVGGNATKINVGKNAKQEKCFFLQRKCIQQIHRYKYIQ